MKIIRYARGLLKELNKMDEQDNFEDKFVEHNKGENNSREEGSND